MKNIYKLNEKLISKQTKNSFKTNAKGYKLCQQHHIRKGVHFVSACQVQPWGFRIWLTDTGALGWRANDSNRKWADHYLRPIWAVFKHSLNDGWWGTHFCSTAKQRSFVHLMSGGQGQNAPREGRQEYWPLLTRTSHKFTLRYNL